MLKDAGPEAFEMVLNYIYTDRIDPTKKIEDPLSNRIVLLMMDVYRLAVQFNMKRLEQLCVHYLQATINHANVLEALHNAACLKLYFIKELCLSFVVKDSNYNQIVMSQEFETLDQPLMVEIIRKKQLPPNKNFLKYYDSSADMGKFYLSNSSNKIFQKHVYTIINFRNNIGARHGSFLEGDWTRIL